jgi:hypothetical protein
MTGTGKYELGPVRSCLAWIGATFIYFLIWAFGRLVRADDVPWLHGPVGSDYIGDEPYEEHAALERLQVVRRSIDGGLVPRFDVLGSSTFDASRVHRRVRDFYEHTAAYRMDVWAKTSFPANVALWLLVTTISRKVNQLNFPLDVLETARGMDSEIVLLTDAEGETRYTGWYRRLAATGHVLYTGFYMTETVPLIVGRCVKVVFPMPNGNATVVLRPAVDERGDLILDSDGQGFGDAGFYRIPRARGGRLRVWRNATLKESFRVFVDDEDTLRCDHAIRFLGFSVLKLHYRIERKPTAEPLR